MHHLTRAALVATVALGLSSGCREEKAGMSAKKSNAARHYPNGTRAEVISVDAAGGRVKTEMVVEDGAWKIEVPTDAVRGLDHHDEGLSHVRDHRPRGRASASSFGGDSSPPVEPLKAGSTDDNESFDEFLGFLDQWRTKLDASQAPSFLDVGGRRSLTVQDARGAPIPGAVVRLFHPDSGARLFEGTAFGDGRVPIYPRVYSLPDSVRVEISRGDRKAVDHWELARKTPSFVLPDPAVGQPTDASIPVDVLLLVDTTSSMSDEIESIKGTLRDVVHRVRKEASQEVDLRFGAVLYRDQRDDYVTQVEPFTSDLSAFASFIHSIQAAGGGDAPEDLGAGLEKAMAADWRQDAAKVVFLVGDAPPQTGYANATPYGASLKRAVERGVRIHSVAASGLDAFGTFVFRQAAQLTRGQFIYIEYGAPGETAKKHGVARPGQSTNLGDILFERLRAEIEGYGRRGSS